MTSPDNAGALTDEAVRELPDHDLTIMYDISLKIAADWHEPNQDAKRLAAANEAVCRLEMQRRGIFDKHVPR